MTAISPGGFGARRAARAKTLIDVAVDGERLPERDVVVTTGLVIVSMLTIWVLLQMLVLGGLEHARSQDRLYEDFRAELSQGLAPTGGVIAPGDPVALVSIDALGMQQVVVEGTSSGLLLDAPGHRRDTVLPGQAGISVLYGRSTSFGRPFGGLADEAVGRTVQVVTGQGRASYRIEGVRRAGDPVPAPPAEGKGRLTFVTADGSGRLGGLRPNGVVYLDASLQSKAFAAGPQRVNTISTSERPMSRDTSVLPMLALALGGLLITVVGASVGLRRFGPVLTWTVAVPVVAALLWFIGDLSVYLLPNLV